MKLTTFLAAAAAAATLSAAGLPARAQDGNIRTTAVGVEDAYARVSTPNAKSGAIFMVLSNFTAEPDRLIGAASDVAERVELHTHKMEGGVMKMLEDEDGFEIPAGGTHALERGADHVMLMGLTRPLQQGDTVTLKLTFEKAGELEVEVPVDSTR
jgi:copper(I)-binding protein